MLNNKPYTTTTRTKKNINNGKKEMKKLHIENINKTKKMNIKKEKTKNNDHFFKKHKK